MCGAEYAQHLPRKVFGEGPGGEVEAPAVTCGVLLGGTCCIGDCIEKRFSLCRLEATSNRIVEK